jgi:hypothetical protein
MDGVDRVTVQVTGTVFSVGWLDPHLMSIDTHESSADNYIDLTFLIVRPNAKTSAQDVMHRADKTFPKDDQGATVGVRVWAENGCIELAWSGYTSATVKSFDECVKTAGLVPVP